VSVSARRLLIGSHPICLPRPIFFACGLHRFLDDSWCTIRNAAFQAVDRVLAKAAGKSKAFSTSQFLVNRGAPISIPKPDDFPFIGYVTREEAAKILARLDPAKINAAIEKAKEDQEWLEEAIGELRSWLESCVKTDRDLICFYF
jgi:hypothetical protein